jgi:hypothetical protein
MRALVMIASTETGGHHIIDPISDEYIETTTKLVRTSPVCCCSNSAAI